MARPGLPQPAGRRLFRPPRQPKDQGPLALYARPVLLAEPVRSDRRRAGDPFLGQVLSFRAQPPGVGPPAGELAETPGRRKPRERLLALQPDGGTIPTPIGPPDLCNDGRP